MNLQAYFILYNNAPINSRSRGTRGRRRFRKNKDLLYIRDDRHSLRNAPSPRMTTVNVKHKPLFNTIHTPRYLCF